MKNLSTSGCFESEEILVALNEDTTTEEKNSVLLLEKANFYVKTNPEEWTKRKQTKKLYADRKLKIYKVHPIILEMHTLRDLRINEKHKEWKENNNKQVNKSV